MAVRLPELSALPAIEDPNFNERLRAYMREFGLNIEGAFDRVEDEINTEVNPVTESFARATSNYSVGRRSVVLADTSSAGFTVTLPAPSSANRAVFTIKKVSTDSNTLTVDAIGGALIDGSATFTTSATDYPVVKLFSDGTSYWKV